MIKPYLKALVQGQTLTENDFSNITDAIFSEQVDDVSLGAYLAELSCRGATADAVVGTVKTLRRYSPQVHFSQPVMDIVGTGGDGFNTFNISTTVSFVVAAAGVPVAKHGNNAATSLSGAADVLSALGVSMSKRDDKAARYQLDRTGQTFLYAKQCHPILKTVARVRQQLGLPTIFNIVGPLANPAQPA